MAAWAVCASAVALGLFGCRKAETAPEITPPEVQVVDVQPRDVPIYGYWIGTLDGMVNAEIRAQVSGYLLTQDYREGDFVHKGDLLFQIDPRPLQAALDVAKGRLGQAEANLGKTEMDVRRYTPLAAKGAISQEDLDNAVAARLGARADVEAAKAAVEQAALNLEFARITSPVDGLAGLALAQIGDLVGPAGPALTTISVIDPVKVRFTVGEQEYLAFRKLNPTEADVAAFRRQSPAELILSSGGLYPHLGRIFAAQREVDVRTGTLEVDGAFPNPDRILRPGMFARVRIRMAERKGSLVVPQRAVTELQGIYQVAVVDAQKTVHLVNVLVGERTGSDWILESGVKAGDRVVVEGLQKVREGRVVAPKPLAAAAPPTTVSPAAASELPQPGKAK
jgi:membrane fusion protein, multidrug efflux system